MLRHDPDVLCATLPQSMTEPIGTRANWMCIQIVDSFVNLSFGELIFQNRNGYVKNRWWMFLTGCRLLVRVEQLSKSTFNEIQSIVL